MSQCSGAEQFLRFMRAHGLKLPPASPRYHSLVSDWYRPRWMSSGPQVTSASHLPSTDNEYDLHQFFFPTFYWLGLKCLIDVLRTHSWCVHWLTTQFSACRFVSTCLLHTFSLVTTRINVSGYSDMLLCLIVWYTERSESSNTFIPNVTFYTSRSQWPRGLRRRSAAARVLRSWVRIPPGAWMFVCCECRVL